MVRIIFRPEFPTEFRDHVTELLGPMLVLCPLWLQVIHVYWDAENEDDNAQIHVNPDYRNAALTVFPKFFGRTKLCQVETMVHEITHLYNSPLYAEAGAILDLMCPLGEDATEPAAKHLFIVLKEKLRNAVETCNSDLTYTHLKIAGWLPEQEEEKPNPIMFRGHIRGKAFTLDQ